MAEVLIVFYSRTGNTGQMAELVAEGARQVDGTEVRIEPVEPRDAYRSLREGLRKFAGIVKGMPKDMARNHDHYLHGAPRK